MRAGGGNAAPIGDKAAHSGWQWGRRFAVFAFAGRHVQVPAALLMFSHPAWVADGSV